jgi:DNA repair protein RadC
MVVLRHSTITITKAKDVAKVFQDLLTREDRIDQDKEHVYVMHLNTRHHINLVELVAIGTLTNTALHPRETFRRAVLEGTDSLIVAHNHPSGDVTPSEADIRVTHQLCKAGEVLQIPLIDHLIFTDTQYYSFRDNKTAHYPILTNPKQTHVEKCAMKKPRMGGGDAKHGINQ